MSDGTCRHGGGGLNKGCPDCLREERRVNRIALVLLILAAIAVTIWLVAL